MKYLISIILLFITSALHGQENSSLTILCPENWTISLNGYVQKGLGVKRVLTFYYPEGQVGQTNIMAFVDGENIVLHSERINLTGGRNTTIDIRPKEKRVEKPDFRPNFNIFGEKPKTDIAKPNFSYTIKKDMSQLREPEVCVTTL